MNSGLSSRPVASVTKGGFGSSLRYRFDNALSRGPSVVIGWLGLLTLLIIVAGMIITVVGRITGIGGGDKSLGLLEGFWQSLLRVLDAGSFAGDAGWPARILGLIVTLLGIFLAGSLIGLIANAVDQKIESLRKGRSAVLEDRHTLILGWSERVPAILSELVIANESERKATVVVMAPEDKTEIEDTLRDHVPHLKTTKLVCRSGDPANPKDLARVNLGTAQSVIVVNGSEGDAGVVKAALAIGAATPPDSTRHSVLEVADMELGTSLREILGDEVVIVNSDHLIAELTAQACRQRGLSQVFRDLLDFDGDEIYFQGFPQLEGHTFGESQLSFEQCAVIGVLDTDGNVLLNPHRDTVIGPNAELIAIAPDDSEFLLTTVSSADSAPLQGMSGAGSMKHLLVLGWSGLGQSVIRELVEFLPDDASVTIGIDPSLVSPDEVRETLSEMVDTVKVIELSGGPQELMSRDFGAVDKVIVLAYREALDRGDADARTLLSVLALRSRTDELAAGRLQVVAEMLDARSVTIAEASGVDDFIVSEELTSLMLAQLSGKRELSLVFEDLFDAGGASVQMIPASAVGVSGSQPFREYVRAGGNHSVSVIGYRVASSGEVRLNPAKSGAVALGPDDELVVIAQSS